jgi:hypothetical protein
MDEELVLLRTFGSEASALLAQAILQGNGIPSVVSSDSASVMEPPLQYSRGTRLSVRRGDMEAAQELLGEE